MLCGELGSGDASMAPGDEVLIDACCSGLDEEQSADVLQRVFVILVERLDAIEQPATLAAWLIGTARHESWRIRRRERAAGDRVSDTPEILDSLEDTADLPEELLVRLERQHELRLAVESLDGRCRQLLTLLFLTPDPPSYAEIAVRLGMRPGAIGPSRARCLQKLRQLLPEDF